jgi:hypothetical protein
VTSLLEAVGMIGRSLFGEAAMLLFGDEIQHLSEPQPWLLSPKTSFLSERWKYWNEFGKS